MNKKTIELLLILTLCNTAYSLGTSFSFGRISALFKKDNDKASKQKDSVTPNNGKSTLVPDQSEYSEAQVTPNEGIYAGLPQDDTGTTEDTVLSKEMDFAVNTPKNNTQKIKNGKENAEVKVDEALDESFSVKNPLLSIMDTLTKIRLTLIKFALSKSEKSKKISSMLHWTFPLEDLNITLASIVKNLEGSESVPGKTEFFNIKRAYVSGIIKICQKIEKKLNSFQNLFQKKIKTGNKLQLLQDLDTSIKKFQYNLIDQGSQFSRTLIDRIETDGTYMALKATIATVQDMQIRKHLQNSLHILTQVKGVERYKNYFSQEYKELEKEQKNPKLLQQNIKNLIVRIEKDKNSQKSTLLHSTQDLQIKLNTQLLNILSTDDLNEIFRKLQDASSLYWKKIKDEMKKVSGFFSGVKKVVGSAYGVVDTMENFIFPSPTQLSFYFGGIPAYFLNSGLNWGQSVLKNLTAKIQSFTPEPIQNFATNVASRYLHVDGDVKEDAQKLLNNTVSILTSVLSKKNYYARLAQNYPIAQLMTMKTAFDVVKNMSQAIIPFLNLLIYSYKLSENAATNLISDTGRSVLNLFSTKKVFLNLFKKPEEYQTIVRQYTFDKYFKRIVRAVTLTCLSYHLAITYAGPASGVFPTSFSELVTALEQFYSTITAPLSAIMTSKNKIAALYEAVLSGSRGTLDAFQDAFVNLEKALYNNVNSMQKKFWGEEDQRVLKDVQRVENTPVEKVNPETLTEIKEDLNKSASLVEPTNQDIAGQSAKAQKLINTTELKEKTVEDKDADMKKDVSMKEIQPQILNVANKDPEKSASSSQTFIQHNTEGEKPEVVAKQNQKLDLIKDEKTLRTLIKNQFEILDQTLKTTMYNRSSGLKGRLIDLDIYELEKFTEELQDPVMIQTLEDIKKKINWTYPPKQKR